MIEPQADTLHLIANPKSGQGSGESLPEVVVRLATEKKIKCIHYSTKSPTDLESTIQKAIDAALTDGGIIVAAGGDGTIRSVAEKVMPSGLRLGILPCGTFNYFARAHNIPLETEAALQIIFGGYEKLTRLGEFNGRTFLINASLGLYVKSITQREIDTDRFGRHRIVALFSMLKTLLRPHRLLQVTIKSKGVDQHWKTPMVFIGNNALQLRNLKLSVATCFQQNLLAVVLLKPVRGLEILRVIWRGIIRTLEKEERLHQLCTDSILIQTRRPYHTVALDGELFEMKSPFVVNSVPGSLRLMAPKPDVLH